MLASRRGRLVALAVVLTFSVVAAISAIRLAAPPAPITGGSDRAANAWSAALLDCAVQGNGGAISFDQACVTDAWIAAVDADDLPAFTAAIETQEAATPIISQLCHDAGHKAGQAAWQKFGSLPVLFDKGVSVTKACNNGFMHGSLDGLATSNPSDGDLQSAVEACLAIADPELRATCTDGSGHGIWQARHDIPTAVDFCARYPDDNDRYSCVGGVIMQMYRIESDGSRPADFTLDQARTDMPAVCAQIATWNDPISTEACYANAAVPFGKTAGELTSRYVDDVKGRGIDSEVTMAQVQAAWIEAAAACEGFPTEWVQVCKLRVAATIAWDADWYDDVIAEACTAFDGALRESCLTSRR